MSTNDDLGVTIQQNRPANVDELAATIIAQPTVPPAPLVSTGSSAGANPDAPVPFVFGSEIARGGMGSILKADDCKLGRVIAVKIMLSELDADEDQKQRFINEAGVLARLAHPNIVPIYDIGRDSKGQLYYTMKLVKGRTLQAVLNDLRNEVPETAKHYTLDRLLTIFRKVCDAMAFAHSHGIIHRDLKPENIMVGEFGEVLVMDWGLAKILKDEGGRMKDEISEAASSSFSLSTSSLTATLQGSVMGTPQYMSPEQAEGRIADMDARSDIFSLGGILYCILTLRPPVEGKTLAEVLQKVATGSITPPSIYGTTTGKGRARTRGEVLEAKKITPLPHVPAGRVPAALSAVAMKALTLEKLQRYQDVAALSADIEKYQGGFATSAEQAGLAKQLLLLIKRNKGIFTTAAAAWLLITALGIWFMFNLRAKEQRALAGELSAKAAEAVAVREKEATRQALAKSALSLAEAALREADGPSMQAALKDVPEDLRDSTWSYLLAQADSSISRIRPAAAQIEGVAADPSRPGIFAVADRNRMVTVLNVRTGERLLEFQPAFSTRNTAYQYRLAFSQDGQRLAVGRDGPGGIVIHRARDGVKEIEWATPANQYLEFGGTDQLLRHGSGTLQVWNSLTGTLLWGEHEAGAIGAVGVFMPGGEEVLKMTGKSRLQVVKARDGSLVRNLGGRSQYYRWSMVVHPDGRSAFTYTVGGITECVSLVDGKTLFTLPQKQSRDWLGVTADGDQLVTAAVRSNGVQLIEVWNARTGDTIRSLLGGQGNVVSLGVHPRSNELLISGASTRAWDLTGQLPRWRLPSFLMGTTAFWGSDDLLLSQAGGSNTWGLRRVTPTGTELVWQPKDQNGYTAAVSANGVLAVSARPGSNNNAQLLRRSGDSVEEFGQIQAAFWPYRLRPSPDGELLALMERATTANLQVFSVASGKIAVSPELAGVKRINDLGWLGKERLVGLVTVNANRGDPGSEEKIILWDAATGKVLQSVTNATAMEALAVAPEARRFAEAGADKVIRIRDAGTLAVQSAFRAHDAPITVLAWHPAKALIASGSEDFRIRVLDVEKGRQVTELRGLLSKPDHLAFSTTGKRLGAKTTLDELIRIWQLEDDLPATPQPVSTTHAAPVINGWEDLLAPLTPSEVAKIGNGWRMEGGVLSSSDKGFAALPLGGNFSNSSYQIRVQLRQLAPQCFHLVLPVGEHLTGFDLDGVPQDGYCTGMVLVDGKHGISLPGSVKGRQIRDSNKHDLEIIVKLDGSMVSIKATLDNQPLYEWSGSGASLSQHSLWKTPRSTLALGSFSADWVVSEVKVKRL